MSFCSPCKLRFGFPVDGNDDRYTKLLFSLLKVLFHNPVLKNVLDPTINHTEHSTPGALAAFVLAE